MSSRKEQKEALRQERLAQEQAAAAGARRKRMAGLAVAGLLAAAAVAAIVLVLLSGGDDGGGGAASGGGGENASQVSFPDDPPDIPVPAEFDLKKAAEAAGCKLQSPENEGADHVAEDVTYQANPPTSGNHDPNPQEDGAYEEPPDRERTVHSLEHGRVMIQFRPTIPAAEIGRLKALFDEDSYHMLLFPNPDLPAGVQVAASAWDNSLTCSEIGDETFDAIRAFKDQFRDKGPEFVP